MFIYLFVIYIIISLNHIYLAFNTTSLSKNLPMWSRGFAHSCCDVFPHLIGSKVGNRAKTWFEHGDDTDSSYFYVKNSKNEIKNGSIVYVVSSDMPDFFINVFIKLPIDHKIILVSGCEDIGVPYELFNPNRPYLDYNEKAMWPHGRQGLTIQSILQDNRLHKWYIQNYDLEGCNVNTCSTIKINDNIIDKLVPIPIGMDFHSFSSIRNSQIMKVIAESDHFKEYKLIKEFSKVCTKTNGCRQNLSVVVSFDCHFDNTKLGLARQNMRGKVCDVFKLPTHRFNWVNRLMFHPKDSNQTLLYSSGSVIVKLSQLDSILDKSNFSIENRKSIVLRIMDISSNNDISSRYIKSISFWLQASFSKYAIAPPGFGTDTHRVWEILQFDCVPIVISSTLDKLYRQYPIIIVKSWEELTDVNHIESLYDDIITRFGDPPFNDNISYQLTLDYWINKVKDEQRNLFS